jgi:hypothetical protein
MEVEIKIGNYSLLLVVGRKNQYSLVSLNKLTYNDGNVEFAETICEL